MALSQEFSRPHPSLRLRGGDDVNPVAAAAPFVIHLAF